MTAVTGKPRGSSSSLGSGCLALGSDAVALCLCRSMLMPTPPPGPLIPFYKTGIGKQKQVHCSVIYKSQDTEAAHMPITRRWVERSWGIYTMERYQAITKTEILPSVSSWMDPEGTVLREISQTEKDTYPRIPLTCGV